MKLRRNKLNIILTSKRKINDNEKNKRIEIDNKIKSIENFSIPSDFQFKVYKYYENVIFL